MLAKGLFVIFLFIFVVTSTSFACSIQVDDNYDKNILVANAASFNDLSLASASEISITSFSRSFSGELTPSSCPNYMRSSARISMSSTPVPFQNCSYTVTVVINRFIGEVYPAGPIEEISFESPEAACSTAFSKLKLPKKRDHLVVIPKKP